MSEGKAQSDSSATARWNSTVFALDFGGSLLHITLTWTVLYDRPMILLRDALYPQHRSFQSPSLIRQEFRGQQIEAIIPTYNKCLRVAKVSEMKISCICTDFWNLLSRIPPFIVIKITQVSR